ncbi:Conserved hypothetical protein [Clostridium neonatale]|uniref:hypothetical protein n=1 Tax=Clostridium neonatale TaxID=137838 RepID=UPI00291BFE7E|nr:hypothetical protein [Clostridium neonatale]CAI3237695.1 Conserved hypothetical protein [Clostridium neonatale]CAI3653927.1 Conserved hypothetical protein [Clostridium neonatale]
MSDYTMDIGGKIELSDYSDIFDYLNIIDKDDNFMIRIAKDNEDDIGVISSMLNDSNFIIHHTEYDERGNYYIGGN